MNKCAVIVNECDIPTITNFYCLADVYEVSYKLSDKVVDILQFLFTRYATSQVRVIPYNQFRKGLKDYDGVVHTFCDNKHLPEIHEWVLEQGTSYLMVYLEDSQ